MKQKAWASLRLGLALSGLGPEQLWFAYIALGGSRPATELYAFLEDGLPWPHEECQMLAGAIDEALMDADISYRVA